jgi:hypothetical protein
MLSSEVGEKALCSYYRFSNIDGILLDEKVEREDRITARVCGRDGYKKMALACLSLEW